MDHGGCIKNLRESQGMDRKRLAEGIMSVGKLKRIEEENAKVDYETMFDLLERMNIYEWEYYYRLHSFQCIKKEDYRLRFREVIENERSADEFLAELQSEYQVRKDIFYFYMMIQTKSVIAKQGKLKVRIMTEEDEKVIREHLDKTPVWSYFDIAMYTNCLDHFSKECRHMEFDQVYKNIQGYKGSMEFQFLKMKFLTNSIIMAFEESDYAEVRKILPLLYDMAADSDYIKARLYHKLFSHLYRFVIESLEMENEMTIETFRICGYREEANLMAEFKQRVMSRL